MALPTIGLRIPWSVKIRALDSNPTPFSIKVDTHPQHPRAAPVSFQPRQINVPCADLNSIDRDLLMNARICGTGEPGLSLVWIVQLAFAKDQYLIYHVSFVKMPSPLLGWSF